MKFSSLIVLLTILLAFSCSKDSLERASDTGIGGSLARFVVIGSNLYVVNKSELKTFDISVPDNPSLVNTQTMNFGVETIYPFKEYLFIGSQTGMYIFKRKADGTPEFISDYEHFASCDPVVADDNYAYVTLRSGRACNIQSGFNQLEILDISDIFNPSLVNVIEMSHPAGLGKDGNLLFVCDEDQGLKIFDATNPLDMQMIHHEQGINVHDVIPINGLLIVVGVNNIYQFDYTDPSNIIRLSAIPIQS